MDIRAARALNEIFKRIQRRQKHRKPQLIDLVTTAAIPEADQQFLLHLIEHYVDRRTQLTDDLRRRPSWKIISDCFDIINPQQACALANDLKISVGALSLNLHATEKALSLLNEIYKGPTKDENDELDLYFCHQTIAQATPDGRTSAYPFSILGAARIGSLSPEDKVVAAIFDQTPLPASEQHENFHHLFNLILRLRGGGVYSATDIMRYKKRLDKLTQLEAPDIILKPERMRLLDYIQILYPDVQLLDDITEEGWQEIADIHQQEAVQRVYEKIANELLACFYAGQTKNLHARITHYYMPDWLERVPGDFDDTLTYDTILGGAIKSLVTLIESKLCKGVIAMILIDHDIREWPEIVDQITSQPNPS
ncbi:hypothetical protein FWD07_03065 [Candidatus Saccharibacteria bacterium]|nr:hypothetical protein [Candidatus Saccharibacteria bacterium]